MPIYMKIDGIDGNVTTEGFEKQIELGSAQFGVGLAVSPARGGDRTASEPNLSEIVVTKQIDKSTEKILKAIFKGEPVGKALLSFTAASKGEAVAYLTIELEDVIISSYSQSSGGDIPMESLSLNFTKIDYCYIGRDKEQTGSPVHTIYNLETNKVG